jgi:hypothetical protein
MVSKSSSLALADDQVTQRCLVEDGTRLGTELLRLELVAAAQVAEKEVLEEERVRAVRQDSSVVLDVGLGSANRLRS